MTARVLTNFIALFFIFKSLISLGSNSEFHYFRDSNKNSKLTPYEKCLVQLDRIDKKHSLYSQPECNLIL